METLFIDTFNPIFKESTNFIFCDVQVLLWINGNDFINYGDTNSIMSLSVEEDYSYLQSCDQVCGKNNLDDSIYLLFQMLNLDELHIISKEVCIDVKKGVKL